MAHRYSRLESVEEKKNVRSAAVFIILTVVVVALLIFVGIPAVGRLAAFVSGLKNSNNPSTSHDTTPPAPPKFISYPDFTNQQTANITGTAEPGATVKLTFNGNGQDTIVDKDGKFTFQNLSLVNGDNVFSAITLDSAGNKSQPNAGSKIVYDTTPPELTIDSPSDGSKFFGSGQRQVTIQGTTDPNASITINDRIVSVEDSGKFQYTLTLNSGDNVFTVKAVDLAGNTTEKNITLNFSE